MLDEGGAMKVYIIIIIIIMRSYGWQWGEMGERERRRVQMRIIKRGVEN